jgi:hypothetical protein
VDERESLEQPDYMISGQSINLAVHAEKTCPFMIRVEVGTVE